MSDRRERDFEDMDDPPLADRLRAFETWLENEPCSHPGNDLLPERLRARIKSGEARGCDIISNTRMMCPSCRLRLHFYHCIYNAEAYEGTSGKIPRKART